MRRHEFEILLIEDNESDAEMTIRSLQKSNVTNKILHLQDGAIALEYLFGTGESESRNVNINPKLILLDLKMPKVDGLEVLKRIKSDERTKTIPVVMLTSSKEDPDIKTCYSLGVNSYIVKPVDFVGFNKVVGELGLYWILVNQPPV
jgi:two-component system, response regulator